MLSTSKRIWNKFDLFRGIPCLCRHRHQFLSVIDQQTIAELERNSLVNFENERGIKIVEEAIEFAEQLSTVNTEGVEPLVSVLEESTLFLRDDTINDGNCQKLITSNAKLTEDGYFVAPPGNIPVETKTYDFERLKIEAQK